MAEISVNFYWVILSLIASLAILSLAAHWVVRRHVALVWLAAALFAGAISTIVFTKGGSGASAFAVLALSDTFAAYCLCQSLRLSMEKSGSGRAITAVAVILTLCSLLLIAAGTDPVVQCIPFQIAGFVLTVSALSALISARAEWVGRGLIVGTSMYAITQAIRAPFFPSLLDGGTAFPSMASPWLNWFLLATSSIYVPLVVLLIIANDIGGVIANYRERSQRDGLTGLLTRQPFEEAVGARRERFGVLIACDIDHFKRVNDTYGHAVGDDILRAFAERFDQAGRIAGRIGGEEFVIALPGATLPQAETIAEQLRRTFHELRHPALAEAHRLSASFGIAAYGGRESLAATLEKADSALYRAKRQGRNCVVLHGTGQDEQANLIVQSA
ncbi:MAG: GGDEF domain-containing protein [Sphingomicrobium sp.]